ncbi:MAG TPA: hypothetical protein VLG50_04090 [Candidatus Saccharimonadales bacterium]|nr:hypothetical protein [Candidatus Saccharimonadales bacterium]
MKTILLIILNIYLLTAPMYSMQNGSITSETTQLLNGQSSFFQDINTRLSNREKVKLKNHILQQKFHNDFIITDFIQSRCKTCAAKDKITFTPIGDPNDTPCRIDVNILVANVRYDNDNIVVVKQYSYQEFMTLIDTIQQSDCCGCC